MEKNNLFQIFSGLAMVGQLGIQLIMPPLLLVLLGVWLRSQFGIGVWLPIVLLVVGLITAGCSFWRTVRVWQARNISSTDKKENPHES